MTLPIDDMHLDEEGTEEEGAQIFQEMSAIAPELDVDVGGEAAIEDDGDGDGHRSLEEVMAGTPNLSDMQAADRRLYPDLGEKYLNHIQVSRVFPDVYNPMARILVKDLLQKSNGDLSVAEAIANVNTGMSIGIDGEGRIDMLGLVGKATDAEVEKEKNKGGMGLV